jgi:hypothetical protein
LLKIIAWLNAPFINDFAIIRVQSRLSYDNYVPIKLPTDIVVLLAKYVKLRLMR